MFRRKFFLLKRTYFLLILLLVSLNISAQATSVYYFFPDSPSSNLRQLKGDMENMFAEANLPVIFQPFARLRDFKRELSNNPPDFLISPTWFTLSHKNYQHILKAYRNGKPEYVKLLITNAHFNENTISLNGKSLAVTRMGNDDSWSNQLFDGKHDIKLSKANIIEVVKDVDAIFAVALKHVDMALVAKSTMEKLKKINPHIINSIQIIAESKPLPMPALTRCKGKHPDPENRVFIEFMKTLTKKNKNVFRKLLLIDEWRPVK
ncbi:MAG TPA: hypothetical protein ENK06_14310 [Gammaproteobacteria bacterium]|nr:hypothetical protein [Gammaproteobacteria bacterium]